MPTQKLISRAKWMVDEYILNIATDDAKMGGMRCEADNFVIILHNY